MLIADEEAKVKAALRARPDRCIRIATLPRERDPAYADLLAAQAALPPAEGAIWGELDGDHGEVHLILRWSEWPGFQAMWDDRVAMLTDRAQRVAEWIHAEHGRGGLSLFLGR